MATKTIQKHKLKNQKIFVAGNESDSLPRHLLQKLEPLFRFVGETKLLDRDPEYLSHTGSPDPNF